MNCCGCVPWSYVLGFHRSHNQTVQSPCFTHEQPLAEPLLGKSLVVCWCARAAITKYCSLGGLNNGKLFSHRSGVQRSKIKVLEGLISSEPSSACRWLHLHVVSTQPPPHPRAHPPSVSLHVQVSCTCRNSSHCP